MKPETHAQGDGHGQVKGAANGAPKPISSHAAHAGKAHPLDMERSAYSYVERPNPAIQALYKQHIASKNQSPRVLDIGCGCGANDREFKKRTPHAYVVGIEPNPRAAELASRTCDEVFPGMLEDWLKQEKREPVDVVVLSDVLEHIADPIAFLRALATAEPLRHAQWIISVPNYGVWYNRVRTLLGIQGYSWSGIWDRTHLRFFTRDTIRELLTYCGFELLDDSSTPALVQSLAPLLRKAFERNVSEGDHLALADSRAFALYQKAVEPVESLVCGVWPELLALQIVHLARLR
ncbi:MAG: class I SAM-dependent methyltransferase [Polyangiaceae bacterium]